MVRDVYNQVYMYLVTLVHSIDGHDSLWTWHCHLGLDVAES